jgi:hypothetical protein
MGKFDNQTLDNMRQMQDAPADALIAQFFPKDKTGLQQLLGTIHVNEDLMSLPDDSPLKVLSGQILNPNLLDKEIMITGRKFFDENASDIMLLLGFLSLPYCYAAANGAEVLVRSKRIIEQPGTRLAETAHFVFDVFGKDAFSPQGKGYVSILKVRLMHAATRWYILQGKWNADQLGKPVNQEDMAGTNLSFSLMVVRGLRRMGKLIHGESALAYIQYWNMVGRMLGLREELLPQSNKEAHLLEKNIRSRQFKKSEVGETLMASLVKYYDQAAEGTPLEGKVKQMLEFLLGSKVAKLLGISIADFEVSLFKPYTVVLRLQNQLLKKNDGYQMAWHNYQQQSKALSPDASFSLK